MAAHWTPFKLWWRNYASRIILSTVCTTYWTGGGVFSLSDSFSCAAVRINAGNLAVSLDIATHLSEQYDQAFVALAGLTNLKTSVRGEGYDKSS